MSKKREYILLKVNAVLLALIGLLGCRSCNYLVKYGVPEGWIERDSTYVDTLVRCMYGVNPIVVDPTAYQGDEADQAPAADPQEAK